MVGEAARAGIAWLIRTLHDDETPTGWKPSQHLHLSCLGFESEEHFRAWWNVVRAELGAFVLLGIDEHPDGGVSARLRTSNGEVWAAEVYAGGDERVIALRIGPAAFHRVSDIQAIWLNGVSSSGKTAVAHALQVALPGVWLHFSPDMLALTLLPRRPHR